MADGQLARVALNLNQLIVEFWKLRLSSAEKNFFTSTELRQYVNRSNFGTAPASADRVLRDLRKKGKVNYAVVNRGKSLYLALPVGTETKTEAQQ
jgi:hypothetical protein